MKEYIRISLFQPLWEILHSDPNLIQAVVGARQVGKTTLALQIFKKWEGPKIYETADQPSTPPLTWLDSQWQKAREMYRTDPSGQTVLLILDEVQKIPDWSELVKKLFDEDKRYGNKIRVLLLGSSSLLMQKGLAESLAGRFELHRHNQWSFVECNEYFGITSNEYIFFGGYPGAIPLRRDEIRWARYIRDSIIETVLSKDVLLMSPVTKPALLRQTFGLAVNHPAEVLSYQKMLGSLQDAGNTTTIASYLELLSNAFLIKPLQRWSGSKIRQRGSIPKILALDNALVSAMMSIGFKETLNDRKLWGRLLENAVGARLNMIADNKGGSLFYWRERVKEVDYILRIGKKITAIEVKSGNIVNEISGLSYFCKKYSDVEGLIISNLPTDIKYHPKSVNIEDFFKNPESYL